MKNVTHTLVIRVRMNAVDDVDARMQANKLLDKIGTLNDCDVKLIKHGKIKNES